MNCEYRFARSLGIWAAALLFGTAIDDDEIRVTLPAGERQVQSTSTRYVTTARNPFFRSSSDSPTIVLEAHGHGPFEAEIVVRETGRSWLLPGSQVSGDLNRSLQYFYDHWDVRLAVAAGAGAAAPCDLNFETGDCVWRQDLAFASSSLRVPLQLAVPEMPSEIAAAVAAADPDLEGLDIVELDQLRHYSIEVVLRRVRADQCYMLANVSGGPGAGAKRGDVAVLGDNPTGLNIDDLVSMAQGFQTFAVEGLSPEVVDRMMANVSPEDRARWEEGQEAMREAMSQNPVDRSDFADIDGMWTLTLEDVRFGDTAPGSSGEAIMKMANHFVLTAVLTDAPPTQHPGPTQPGQPPMPLTLGVESVGMKEPALGLASTKVEGCEVAEPILTLKPCPGDEWQELDAKGAICGNLWAELCNEQLVRFTVDATFLAARSLDQCIR